LRWVLWRQSWPANERFTLEQPNMNDIRARLPINTLTSKDYFVLRNQIFKRGRFFSDRSGEGKTMKIRPAGQSRLIEWLEKKMRGR